MAVGRVYYGRCVCKVSLIWKAGCLENRAKCTDLKLLMPLPKTVPESYPYVTPASYSRRDKKELYCYKVIYVHLAKSMLFQGVQL